MPGQISSECVPLVGPERESRRCLSPAKRGDDDGGTPRKRHEPPVVDRQLRDRLGPREGRVRANDWEQTKADFSKDKGHELNQNVGDTVKQAAGKKHIPSGAQPDDKPESKAYDRIEPRAPLRLQRVESHFAEHTRWDASLETKMRDEWNKLHADQKFSDEVKGRRAPRLGSRAQALTGRTA